MTQKRQVEFVVKVAKIAVLAYLGGAFIALFVSS